MKPVLNRTLLFISCALFLLILAIWAERADAEPLRSDSTKRLTVTQVKQDVALAKKAYSKIHPGYTRYSSSNLLDESWNGIVSKAERENGLTLGEFYLALQKTLTLIRCDHTKANLPKSLINERDSQPYYLPFRWRWIEERAFVILPIEGSALKVMDEILSIDGMPIKERVDAVLPYIPYDGKTTWSRLSGVTDSLEFKGGAIDHFGALIWGTHRQVVLEVKSSDGNVQQLSVDRINHKQLLKLQDKSKSARNFKDAVVFERIGEETAYLRIDTFVNYRVPVKPADIYNPIFKALKEEKRKTLILDLRNNGGGSSDASLGLLANLITEPRQATKEMRVNTLDLDDLREHLWTWDKRALDPSRIAFSKNDDGTYSFRSLFTDEMDTISPAKYAFKGNIIALTSNDNSSGSTNLLAQIQDTGRATLVGEKTGGSVEGPTAGLLFTLTLPESKITTRIPFFRYFSNVKSFEPGFGVFPDKEVKQSAGEFIKSEDSILSAAMKLAL